MGQPNVSVIVCTRNRGELLRSACDGFLALHADPEENELLIVDNGSGRASLDVAVSVCRENPDQIRLVREPRAGLSRARNAGVEAALGELLLFLDDDAVPNPGWLAAYLEAFREDAVWAAGGPVDPVFSGDLPPWLGDRFLPYLTVWDKGDEPVDLTYNEYPRGANMAFRKAAFHRYGPFHLQLGRQRRSLRSCEEIEMCLRLERVGRRVRYAPRARVRHRVETERLTPEWMARRFWAQGFSEAIMEYAHAGVSGLGLGIRRTRRCAERARFADDREGEILWRCHKRAREGYLTGSVLAPFQVSRYRCPGGERLRTWRPLE